MAIPQAYPLQRNGPTPIIFFMHAYMEDLERVEKNGQIGGFSLLGRCCCPSPNLNTIFALTD